MDASLWDHLSSTGAQSKRPEIAAEPPTSASMQAGIKPAQRKAPTADQKAFRRRRKQVNKEGSTMTHQPTEADLLVALAAATTLSEQSALSARIDAVRAARRESLMAQGSLDWDAMGDLPPSRYQQNTALLAATPSAASMRTTASTDWLEEITPTHTEDQVLTAQMRAQATAWYSDDLWEPVKADPQELSVQTHNAARRASYPFGMQATAAASVFTAQVRHLASREGVKVAEWGADPFQQADGKRIDTYIADGKTPAQSGGDAADQDDSSMDEWVIGSDANGGDPKTSPTTGEQLSLSEGTSPEQATGESGDSPDAQKPGGDHSSWGEYTDPLPTGGTGSATKASGKQANRKVAEAVDDMMAYEQGTLGEDETKVFFQGLIDSGLAWRLQGSYGRMAQSLIESGVCHAAQAPTIAAKAPSTDESSIASLFGGMSGIETYSGWHQASDPTSVEQTDNEANPSLSEGDSPESAHSESPLQPETPAQDKSSGGDDEFTDYLDTGGTTSGNPASGGPMEGTPTTSRKALQTTSPQPASVSDHTATPEWDTSTASDLCDSCGWPVTKGKDGSWSHDQKNPVQWSDKRKTSRLSSEARTFQAALRTLTSLDQSIGGVTGHQIVGFLLSDPTVPIRAKAALRHQADGGQTCLVCGDSIAQDPAGETNRSWHHTNGTKHDHEAKPSGDSSKESRRQAAAAPQGTCAVCGKAMEQESDGSWSHNPGSNGEDYDDDHEAKPAGDSGSKESRRKHAGDTEVCDECGATVPSDGPMQSKSHDPSCSLYPDNEAKESRRRTAGEYGGGSPKEGDTATCHKDDGNIQFFAGEWQHLNDGSGGTSHNDVHPATPKEQADKAKSSSRKQAGEVPEAFKKQWDKGGDSDSDDSSDNDSDSGSNSDSDDDDDKSGGKPWLNSDGTKKDSAWHQVAAYDPTWGASTQAGFFSHPAETYKPGDEVYNKRDDKSQHGTVKNVGPDGVTYHVNSENASDGMAYDAVDDAKSVRRASSTLAPGSLHGFFSN